MTVKPNTEVCCFDIQRKKHELIDHYEIQIVEELKDKQG